MDVVFQLAAAAFTVHRHKRVGLARRGVKTDLVSVVVAAASRLVSAHTAHIIITTLIIIMGPVTITREGL